MTTVDASAAVLRPKCTPLSSSTELNLIGDAIRVHWGQTDHV
jgi:hypothetical protein